MPHGYRFASDRMRNACSEPSSERPIVGRLLRGRPQVVTAYVWHDRFPSPRAQGNVALHNTEDDVMRFLLLAAALAARCAGAAPAESMTAFGVTLGAPLPDLPACTWNGPRPCFETHEDSDTLRTETARRNKATGGDDYIIQLPTDAQPSYMQAGLYVSSINGKTIAIQLGTTGAPGQEAAAQALVEKFGKPTRFAREPLQNKFGARFVGFTATWKRRDGSEVFFDGLSDGLDWGHIEITTPEFRAARDAAKRADAKKRSL